MKYEPSLDGVRALAILGVLVHHVFPERLPGGFTGVDVFFVLSGYLIASVILHGVRDGSFSMREFYLRRIQRLLPNAVAAVLVTVALSFAVLVPSEAVRTARHGAWALLNLSNVFVLRGIGRYWGDSAEVAPLLHTWSLAVEEQFYLLFPAGLLLLSRRGSRSVAALALLAAGSLALALLGAGAYPYGTFYLLPARAWELLLGSALAAFRLPAAGALPVRAFARSRATDAAGLLGLASVVAGFVLVSGTLPYPRLVALVPTLGTAAILVSVAEGRGAVARLLSAPALTAVGRASYSIYLWHWPGVVLGGTFAALHGGSRSAGAFAGAAAGVVVSVIAYRFVEQPLRSRGPGRERRLLGLALAFSAGFAALLVLSFRPTPTDPYGLFDRPAFHSLLYDATGDGSSDSLLGVRRLRDVTVPPPEPRPADSWRTGGIVRAWGAGPPRVVVLGSSHAMMYGRVVDEACRRLGLPVAFLTANGVAPFFRTPVSSTFRTPAEAAEFDATRRRFLRQWKPLAVVAIDRWDSHQGGDLERHLVELVDELALSARSVVLVTQVPALRVGPRVNLREYVSARVVPGRALPRIAGDEGGPLREGQVRAMEALALARPWLRIVRADDLFLLQDGSVRYAEGRTFFYADADHLSEAGADLVKERIAATLAAACGGLEVPR